MSPRTEALWAKQNQHEDDRLRLFRTVARFVDVTTVLYPGSYVDISPSMVFPSVTYVDVDDRARRFFGDVAGVRTILARYADAPGEPEFSFVHADYTTELPIAHQSYDLLVSLFAGFVSEHCAHHLQVGGILLANASHGDAAMASIDRRFALSGVVESVSGDYRIRTDHLDTYMIPKRPIDVTVDLLHQTGRAIAYTSSPFAYVFTRVQ